MKIVLFSLNASYVHKNLAIRCLRKPLEESGFEVVLLEYTIKEKRRRVLSSLVGENADIYCFSTYIWNVSEHLAIAEKLKKILPQAEIVFGGPEVSYENESFFEKNPYVDFVVSGEGEKSLPELCLDIKILGAETVGEKGRIIYSEPYDGFENEGFLYRESDADASSILYYESSRGCPYSCSYCLSASEKGIRAKPAETVLSELYKFESMKNKVKIIKLVDRTFNYDKIRALKIWEGLLSEKYTLSYHFEICAELLDEDAFELLSRFPKGKIQLEAGIQSTSPEILKAINRRSDIPRCISNLKRLKSMSSIHIHADLIAGLPLQSYSSIRSSFDEAYFSCDMLQLGFLKLLCGSPLCSDAEKFGIVCSDIPPYEVLKTRELTFNELNRLHMISDALDRVSNSGSFKYLLEGIIPKIASPFDFFESLSALPELSETVSQLRLFEIMLKFCSDMKFVSETELIGRLRLDYYITESGSCPKFLIGNAEISVQPAVKSLLINKAGAKFFAPATEVHRFNFDVGGYYLIDRKNHLCIRFSESEL